MIPEPTSCYKWGRWTRVAATIKGTKERQMGASAFSKRGTSAVHLDATNLEKDICGNLSALSMTLFLLRKRRGNGRERVRGVRVSRNKARGPSPGPVQSHNVATDHRSAAENDHLASSAWHVCHLYMSRAE